MARRSYFSADIDPEKWAFRIVAIVSRVNRQAAFICLAVALLSQLLLPAMHAAVHELEHARSHDGAQHDGARRWVITHSGGRPVAGAEAAHARESLAGAVHSHDGSTHRHARHPDDARQRARSHELSMGAADAGGHGHHHHGERPGDRHGAGSLEHFAAFYLEATPPTLAIPFRRIEPAVVPLVAGRVFTTPVPRAHAVRGPPEQRGA